MLIDRSIEAAEKGKAHAHALITGQINKGRAKTADRDALLARITATADYAALEGCDLVIEAVFEDPAIKAEVIGKIEAVIGPDTVSRPTPRPCRSPGSPATPGGRSCSSASTSSRPSRR